MLPMWVMSGLQAVHPNQQNQQVAGHKPLERGVRQQTHISSGSGAEPKHCCPSGQLWAMSMTPPQNFPPHEAAIAHGLLSARLRGKSSYEY